MSKSRYILYFPFMIPYVIFLFGLESVEYCGQKPHWTIYTNHARLRFWKGCKFHDGDRFVDTP